MAYDVKIVFSGLCAYVPNKALGAPADPPTRMRLVMPDLRVARKVGVHKVARHLPVLAIDPGFLAGGAGAATGSMAVLPIVRRELSFAFQSTAGIALSIDQSGPDTNFNRGPAMAEAAAAHAKIDGTCLEAVPPRGVVARVQIEAGHLAAHEPSKDEFYFRDKKGKMLSKALKRAHEMSLLFRQVTDFEIRARSLDDASSVASPWLRVAAAAGSTAMLDIGNLCDGDLMLYWDPKRPLITSMDDIDFAAYYTLSAKAATIKKSTFAPILTEQAGGGKTARCHDAIFDFVP